MAIHHTAFIQLTFTLMYAWYVCMYVRIYACIHLTLSRYWKAISLVRTTNFTQTLAIE